MDGSIIGIVALAWLATFGLLQIEHARWKHVDFRLRYVMGMGTVCLGCLGAGVALGSALLAIVPGILATAGLSVILNYANENQAEQEKRTAQAQGEVVGMARGIRKSLTQDLIDKGGSPHGENDPSRSN
jgi:uncharacterized membrane protein YfcA